MYSTMTFWLAVSAALLTGVIAGAVIARVLGSNFGSSLLRNRESQRAVDAMRQEQQHYRDQVTGHFQRTAELVNELTDNYRAVHNHLAQGARELCPDAGNPIPNLPDPATPQGPAGTIGSAQVEPPRDYAPRGRTDLGPLHEAYGLDEAHGPDKYRRTPEPPRH